MKSYVSAANTFTAKDNVLVLLQDRLVVDTVPLERLQGVIQRLDRQEPVDQVLNSGWDIAFANFEHAEIGTGSSTFKVKARHDGRAENFSFSLGARGKGQEFADWLQPRLGQNWQHQVTNESRLKATLTYWGIIGVFVAVMAFFYFGVKYDFIHQAPAFIATIINVLGLTGLLAIGGLFILLSLGLWIRDLANPGHLITLTKQR